MKAVNGLKVCSKCHEEKPLSDFYKDRRASDGLTCQCKSCIKMYAQSEAGRASDARYLASEKGQTAYKERVASGRLAASIAKYRLTDRGQATRDRHNTGEKCRATLAAYAASEVGRASQARYRATAKGKGARQRAEARRRARKAGADGNHTRAEFVALCMATDFRCLACDRKFPLEKLTEDHIIPLSQGGSDDIDNIQPLCQSCNTHKGIMTTDYRMVTAMGGI